MSGQNQMFQSDAKNGNDAKMVEILASVNDKPLKLRYPVGAAIMLPPRCLETFSFYAVRAVLTLYLTQKLGYGNDTATIIFHSVAVISYLAGVVGAIISDGWLGNFRTIMYFSIVYVFGSVLLTVGSVSVLPISEKAMTLIGLVLINLGSGCVKPSYHAMPGEQFKLPEQAKKLMIFFTVYSIMLHSGTVIAQIVSPILRQDVQCFGENDCYPLSYGVAGLAYVACFVIFWAGKRLYVLKAPTGNMVGVVFTCIFHAIRKRSKDRKIHPRKHWLDYAEDKFGKTVVNEVKALLNVFVLLVPLTLYWALFELQGSRWTLQAARMNGDLGIFRIKPDQMQLVNSLFTILFIPTHQWIIYPLLAKIGIRRPLQKLTFGGVLAGVAVLLSGMIELQIAETYAVLPGAAECQLRIYNAQNCNYAIRIDHNDDAVMVNAMDGLQRNLQDISFETKVPFTMEPIGTDSNECFAINGSFNLRPSTAVSYFVSHNGVNEFIDDPTKSRTGDAVIRVLANAIDAERLSVVNVQGEITVFNGSVDHVERISASPSLYDIRIDGTTAALVQLEQGSVNTILIAKESPDRYRSSVVIVTAPNTVHMLWQLPQYVSMGMTGAIYTVIGLSFCFSEAPASLKAVVQALWMATIGFGHLIDVLIVSVKFFESQANEFFLFAGLMFGDIIVFGVLAYRYKSMNTEED